MASSNELEIEWFKANIIPNILKKPNLIKNFNEKDIEEFQIRDIEIDVIGTQEAFMLTSCYRARLKYEYKGVPNNIRFFVKKTPELPPEVFESINFKALFNNEILAYESIMPALEEFSKINLNLAKFFYGDLKTNFATVVTEDFANNQWRVTKDKVNLSLEHILIGVRYLAQFHGMGFALRKQNPKQFEEITQDLLESRYASDELHPDWSLIIKTSKQRIIKATRQYEPDIKEEFLNDFTTLIEDSINYGRNRMQPREPFVTLCHGDYLRNNVAYKYNEAGKPVDAIMFDLQTLRVSSPMVDLTVFLSLSTFAEVRWKHFKDIFETYCETLKKTYSKLIPETVPEYLSYDSLLKEYIQFLPYSIEICASFLLSLVEPKEETSQEMFTAQHTREEIINDTLTRGGEVVDRELAHQMKEFYELSVANNVNVFKGF